jgi:hypothetical protein
MSESKGLPPAPWRIQREVSCGRECVTGIFDATGGLVIGGDCSGDDLVPKLDAFPEVYAAIQALPLLVAAVRYTVERFDKFENADDPFVFPSSLHKAAQQLRDVLAQIDGGGNNGGKPQ